MKRKLLYGAAFLFITWAATSCDPLGECQFCKIVERTSGGSLVDSGAEAEYCGDDIDAYKDANPPVVDPITGNITQVECN